MIINYYNYTRFNGEIIIRIWVIKFYNSNNNINNNSYIVVIMIENGVR